MYYDTYRGKNRRGRSERHERRRRSSCIAWLIKGIIRLVCIALVLLILLLRVAHKGSIFTPVSGRLVLAIALLVIAEGGVFALLGLVYRPALAITVVAVTMGLCFTVVSQVLREAAALKEENDGTI